MSIKQNLNNSVGWLTLAAMGLAFASPAGTAQAAPAAKAVVDGNEIIVTARRTEERLQDVPISITVFDATKLANNNIASAKDIATYTPGLSTNNRYGSDNTTWTIRGFTQELRTTATVGTYFADVVAPRGSGATQGGDGAGPGQLFDLQNVQVLKGPQGTLFGRNSTGGAVLLVPKKPSDKLEGYVEGSLGDYDLRRIQGAVNIPVGDALRVRVGIDHNERDGYLENAGSIGFGPHGDAGGSVDYTAGRLSVVADLAPNLENYFIGSYSKSESTGVIPKTTQCFAFNPYIQASTGANVSTGGFAASCVLQMAREAKLGFWSVSNPLTDSKSDTETWQLINTTSWNVNDSLKVKNILAYGEFRGSTNLDLFGQYRVVGTANGTETSPLQVMPFNTTHVLAGGYTNAESSFVEELQFQGDALDGRFSWQGGLYYEQSDPLGISGAQSSTQTPCTDLTTFDCLRATNGANSIGRVGYSTTENTFKGKAVYAQASYDLTEQLKLTGGIRYTEDEMNSKFAVLSPRLNANSFLGVPAGDVFWCTNEVQFGAAGSAGNPFRPLSQRFGACLQDHTVKTSAPTWLLDVDYKPIDNVLLYAKWSRGYRQGGVASFAGDQLQDYDKEDVDTYEIGAKTSWKGSMPGYFNVAAFTNDFTNQQLAIGLQCIPTSACSQTNTIANAGASTLNGAEIEAGLTPIEGLRLELSYAYLDTSIDQITDLGAKVKSLGLPFTDIRGLPIGSEIPNSIPNKATFSANYTLPLSEAVGKITFGGTIVYTDAYRAVSDPFTLATGSTTVPAVPASFGSSYGILPESTLVNLNASWDNVLGHPVDIGAFMTNATEEKVYLHANVQTTSGFVSNIIGEPRMWGVRVKYRFGG